MHHSLYLEQLISRLLDTAFVIDVHFPDTTVYITPRTIASEAEKEIALLTKEHIAPLKGLIDDENNEARRNKAYTLLTDLIVRFKDSESSVFLLEKLSKESNPRLIATHLDELSYCHTLLHKKLDTVLELTTWDDKHVQRAAIRLLRCYRQHKERTKIEHFLLDVLRKNSNQEILTSALISLETTGSTKSCADIQQFILETHLLPKVMIIALQTLNKLGKTTQTAFYASMMKRTSHPSVKYVLTGFLVKYGDEKVIEVLVGRVRSILSQKRKKEIVYAKNEQPEINMILRFLLSYKSHHEEVSKLCDWVVLKRMDYLQKRERTWVRRYLEPEYIATSAI